MKNIFIIFSLFLVTFVAHGIANNSVLPNNKNAIKVFLLGGQSNMVGLGQASDLNPPYSQILFKVKIWQPNIKNWGALSPQSVGKNETFGPEIAFGHSIAEMFPFHDIRLIKYAASGTALYNDWVPGNGLQYIRFLDTAKSALSQLEAEEHDYEVAGMLWLQGESDAQENMGEDYQKNLTDFIARIRKEFNSPHMPFIIARVRNYYGGKNGQAKYVREAQVNVAKLMKNVDWFDTDECSMLNEGHYNSLGLIEIGKRFAEKCEIYLRD